MSHREVTPIAMHLLYSSARLVSGQTASLKSALPLSHRIKDIYFLTAFNVGQEVYAALALGSIKDKQILLEDVLTYLSRCFAYKIAQGLQNSTNRHRFILTLAALASYYGINEGELEDMQDPVAAVGK